VCDSGSAQGGISGTRRKGPSWVTFVTADLTDPDWITITRLPHESYESYDAVLTATARHWLHSEPLAALYGQVAELVRDGGVFMNADHMIDETTPRINAGERAHRHAGLEQAEADGVVDWAEWWRPAAQDPVLAAPAACRFVIYGEHADGDPPAVAWHARMPRDKGFAEARAVWCSPSDSLVPAVK
jgi:SAM-dependent methyltransferase